MGTDMQARETFSAVLKGEPITVQKGERADSRHAIVKAYPDMFEPATPSRFEVEQATKEPGEKRGARK